MIETVFRRFTEVFMSFMVSSISFIFLQNFNSFCRVMNFTQSSLFEISIIQINTTFWLIQNDEKI